MAGSAVEKAFVLYLRTGRRLPLAAFRGSQDVELKFNPYHDPSNGQFTSGPQRGIAASPDDSAIDDTDRDGFEGLFDDSVYRPQPNDGGFQSIQFRPPVGGNIRAFQDPMTLQEAFPGLRNAPGGVIISAADSLFNLTGPASGLTTALSKEYSARLIDDIRSVDPSYRLQSFGFPSTFAGQMNQLGRRLISSQPQTH